ncbi:HNH endonuclease [Prunus dulcis]|uniref:HNH endonuclease n=1 Tax=Prunus dulcis TaxID=3755 RepID=A0A4Y1RI48_PRUDU|nr:HNH endonuclease [Prunus dulcis]
MARGEGFCFSGIEGIIAFSLNFLILSTSNDPKFVSRTRYPFYHSIGRAREKKLKRKDETKQRTKEAEPPFVSAQGPNNSALLRLRTKQLAQVSRLPLTSPVSSLNRDLEELQELATSSNTNPRIFPPVAPGGQSTLDNCQVLQPEKPNHQYMQQSIDQKETGLSFLELSSFRKVPTVGFQCKASALDLD